MKNLLKTVLWLVIIALLAFGSFLLYITIVDFRPPEVGLIEKNQNTTPFDIDTITFFNWNLGYAGLGAEMDFFYDDGKKVRPSEQLSRKYLDGIITFMSTHDQVDFWLLQEVDESAKRSYHKNEVKEISASMSGYQNIFTINYKVPFVPVPVYEPMGSVRGGLMILTAHQPQIAERYAYPLIASWPDKLFLLDRCFILTRYPLTNGQDLVVLNTHNSAYVYDTLLRSKELQIIKNKMIEEYNAGNFVIAGGDWNANPPGFKPANGYNGQIFEPSKVIMKANLFPKGWNWAYDSLAPTNRKNYKSFVKGENETTTIDYYVVSPNVEVLTVKTYDLNFENSDHNPVFMNVKLEKSK